MLKQLELQAAKKRKKENGDNSGLLNGLDEDDGDAEKTIEQDVSVPPGCIVKEGELHSDFHVLMTKVDVNGGNWGLYNFYRMQASVQRVHLAT